MRTFIRFRGNCPDAASVSGFAIICHVRTVWAMGAAAMSGDSLLTFTSFPLERRGAACLPTDRLLLDGFVVKPIFFRLRQQENILMSLGASVADTLRHRIRFVPDDVLPEIPTISAKGEGQHPRNADQVFGFEPFRRAPGLLVATTVVVRALGPDTALIVTAPAVCPPLVA